MRKQKILILSVVLTVFLSGCSLLYEFQTEGAWTYGYSKYTKSCFAIEYCWDGNQDNMVVEIPETYQGKNVTALGGYVGRGVPSPFQVSLPESYYQDGMSYVGTEDEEFIPDDDYETFTFHVKIGENIKEIELLDKDHYTSVADADGNILDVLYKTEYYYECAEENEIFYSKDGKLYYTKDDSLVE